MTVTLLASCAALATFGASMIASPLNRTRYFGIVFPLAVRDDHKWGTAALGHQLPPAVSASPKVHGPHNPVAGTIGEAPQASQCPSQSGRVSSSVRCPT